MRATVMLIALAAQTALPQLAPPPPFKRDAALEQAALRWITADAHPLSSADASSAELQPLVRILANARVIGLGEATHGDHEDQLFKVNLLKGLIRAGAVSALAMELNRATAERLDRFVHGGTGSPAALMRFDDGFYKAWSDREFEGLLEWMRDWNRTAKRQVRIFGIDDQSASEDATYALAFVAKHDPGLAARLREPLGGILPIPGAPLPSRGKSVLSLDKDGMARGTAGARRLADAFSANESAWRADPQFQEARYAAEAAWQNFVVFEFDYVGAPAGELKADYLTRRDRYMASNLLALAKPDEGVALWAHNQHVRRALWPKERDATTVGTELYRRLGAQYRCVGFTWSTGSIATVVGERGKTRSDDRETQITLPNDRPGELGSLFGRTRLNGLWIDMANRPRTALLDQWVKTPYHFGEAGWNVDPSKWQSELLSSGDDADLDQVFDVFVWFRRISPAQRLSS